MLPYQAFASFIATTVPPPPTLLFYFILFCSLPVSQSTGASNASLSGLWLQTTLAYVAVLMPWAVLVWCNVGSLLAWALPGLAASNPNVIDLAAQYGRLSCLWLVSN